jgi:hypothetical protein
MMKRPSGLNALKSNTFKKGEIIQNILTYSEWKASRERDLLALTR